jgi:hypothetical protein
MAIVKHFRNSSAIVRMTYDEDDDGTGTLQVTFKSGQTYTLEGVPKAEAQDFANAISPGTYFNTYLKGNY